MDLAGIEPATKRMFASIGTDSSLIARMDLNIVPSVIIMVVILR